MALLGGGVGGAGNPVGGGGSFTGAAQGLQYSGDFVYANSGLIDFNNSGNQTMLKFTTSSVDILAEFHFSYDARAMGGADLGFEIFFNEGVIWTVVIESQGAGTPALLVTSPLVLFIPAYTEVQVDMANPAGSSAASQCNCNIAGQVLRSGV